MELEQVVLGEVREDVGHVAVARPESAHVVVWDPVPGEEGAGQAMSLVVYQQAGPEVLQQVGVQKIIAQVVAQLSPALPLALAWAVLIVHQSHWIAKLASVHCLSAQHLVDEPLLGNWQQP